MNRQTRTFVVLVVAVVVAAAASFGVYRAVINIPVRTVEIATAKAVVAAHAMPVGTLLDRESVKVVDWPAKTPLQGGFVSLEDVLDRGLIAQVAENEPLTESKLASKAAGAGLAPTITAGMRAISVRVNEVIGVAGFVVPGSRVDIVVIISPNDSAQDRISRVVVSNVQVLTANTRYDQDEARKDAKAVKSTVVTLMVSPLDAERIALAQAEGQLMLTLRNPLDVEPTVTPGVRKAMIFASQPTPAATPSTRPAVRRVAAPVVVAPPPAPVLPVVRIVETIKAAKRSEEKIN
jgi:pilus assembly protein CpaB